MTTSESTATLCYEQSPNRHGRPGHAPSRCPVTDRLAHHHEQQVITSPRRSYLWWMLCRRRLLWRRLIVQLTEASHCSTHLIRSSSTRIRERPLPGCRNIWLTHRS